MVIRNRIAPFQKQQTSWLFALKYNFSRTIGNPKVPDQLPADANVWGSLVVSVQLHCLTVNGTQNPVQVGYLPVTRLMGEGYDQDRLGPFKQRSDT
jgi:hypothetical protein